MKRQMTNYRSLGHYFLHTIVSHRKCSLLTRPSQKNSLETLPYPNFVQIAF